MYLWWCIIVITILTSGYKCHEDAKKLIYGYWVRAWRLHSIGINYVIYASTGGMGCDSVKPLYQFYDR